MSQLYDFVVYIGRMQPPTNAHISNIKHALKISKKVIVLFGSSHQPRTIKNPWSWVERSNMILNQIDPADASRLVFNGINDFRYNNQEWITHVQHIVKKCVVGCTDPKIGIIGCKKDKTSIYLDYFPQWELIETEIIKDIDATKVRQDYFTGKLFEWHDKELISYGLKEYLRQWSKTSVYNDLVDEFKYFNQYWESWSKTPYPTIFVTVDCCVIQSGHILLIQRKDIPGKGLWALPGGFIEPNETIKQAAIRELVEETNIDIDSIKHDLLGEKVFDAPNRSLRGRTVTHAFAFQLPDGKLLDIIGMDDASDARWFTLDDALDMEEHLFEDHIELIRWSVNISR